MFSHLTVEQQWEQVIKQLVEAKLFAPEYQVIADFMISHGLTPHVKFVVYKYHAAPLFQRSAAFDARLPNAWKQTQEHLQECTKYFDHRIDPTHPHWEQAEAETNKRYKNTGIVLEFGIEEAVAGFQVPAKE